MVNRIGQHLRKRMMYENREPVEVQSQAEVMVGEVDAGGQGCGKCEVEHSQNGSQHQRQR
jgi:hypothetical protein